MLSKLYRTKSDEVEEGGEGGEGVRTRQHESERQERGP